MIMQVSWNNYFPELGLLYKAITYLAISLATPSISGELVGVYIRGLSIDDSAS